MPSGIAVSASPKLWMVSARSATEPGRGRRTDGLQPGPSRPGWARLIATVRTPSRERSDRPVDESVRVAVLVVVAVGVFVRVIVGVRVRTEGRGRALALPTRRAPERPPEVAMRPVAHVAVLEAPVTMNRGSLRCHGARLSPEECSRALRATWRFVRPFPHGLGRSGRTGGASAIPRGHL